MCRALRKEAALEQRGRREEDAARRKLEATKKACPVMVQTPVTAIPVPPSSIFRRSLSPFGPRVTRLSRAALLAAVLLVSVRCATVAHGTTQAIRVESEPPGAVVSLNCVENSVPLLGRTPITIQVQRKSKSCAVGLAKEGYVPTTVPLQRTLSGVYIGNLLVGGVVGLVADAADGAMYKQGPPVVHVTLVELSRPPVVEMSPQPVVTLPAQEAPASQTRKHMLQDRDGRDVAWMADDEGAVASCTRVGTYDANQIGPEGRASIADEVVRVGGDTLFNPKGGAVFDIYRCGAESGVAQRAP
jgi:hypothetical protein